LLHKWHTVGRKRKLSVTQMAHSRPQADGECYTNGTEATPNEVAMLHNGSVG
jgi:hypothetical protein